MTHYEQFKGKDLHWYCNNAVAKLRIYTTRLLDQLGLTAACLYLFSASHGYSADQKFATARASTILNAILVSR